MEHRFGGQSNLRSAWHKQRLPAPHPQATDVCWVETIHILLDADGIQDAALVDVLGQRQLDEDAMDLGVGIVGLDNLNMQR